MSHKAIVHWRPPNERNRTALPATLRYVALSLFPEEGSNWTDGEWTIEVTFEVPPPEQANRDVSQGEVRFLTEEAPAERLRPGAWFALYEGPVKVADVEVLE